MSEYPHCKTCNAMCYVEHMVDGECVRCTRKRVKRFRAEILKLKGQLKNQNRGCR